MRNVFWLFKYTSLGLATLSIVFQEFQVIHELPNTLLVQLQNSVYVTSSVKRGLIVAHN